LIATAALTEDRIMQMSILVQNIEEMRRREGIEDEELRRDIRAMKIGDCVHLTLISNQRPMGSETVVVRVTRIDGSKYEGALLTRPLSKGLNTLPTDLALFFKREHIHSLHKPGDDLSIDQ